MTETREESPSAGRSNITPFTMISHSERVALSKIMEESSGLSSQQVASNPFGFPCIPIPMDRPGPEGTTRRVPVNVKDEFLGHPVFWISPEFTTFDPSQETEEQWSIRMFFIIMGMGLWTEELNWIDYPYSKGYTYEDADDLEAYRSEDAPSRLDDIKVLDEDDMSIDPETVYASYVVASDTLSGMIQNEYGEYIQDQARAIAHAKHVLKNNPFDVDLTIDADDSFWTTQLFPMLDGISEQYDSRFKPGEPNTSAVTSDLIDSMMEVSEKFKSVLRAFDKATTLLAIPVVQQQTSRSDVFAYLISYMGLGAAHTEQDGSEYDLTSLIIQVTSDPRHKQKGAFDRQVINGAFRIYENAWRRLRFAYANYIAQENLGVTFEDYSELELYISTGSTRSSDNGEG